jgi:hypothetical protein
VKVRLECGGDHRGSPPASQVSGGMGPGATGTPSALEPRRVSPGLRGRSSRKSLSGQDPKSAPASSGTLAPPSMSWKSSSDTELSFHDSVLLSLQSTSSSEVELVVSDQLLS